MPFDNNPIPQKHLPVRQAQNLLTAAILYALKTRPNDFKIVRVDMDDDMRDVVDTKTGQHWDPFMGCMRSSDNCSCTRDLLYLRFWQRCRVRWAFLLWRRTAVVVQMDPRQEEAIKLIVANSRAA